MSSHLTESCESKENMGGDAHGDALDNGAGCGRAQQRCYHFPGLLHASASAGAGASERDRKSVV